MPTLREGRVVRLRSRAEGPGGRASRPTGPGGVLTATPAGLSSAARCCRKTGTFLDEHVLSCPILARTGEYTPPMVTGIGRRHDIVTTARLERSSAEHPPGGGRGRD